MRMDAGPRHGPDRRRRARAARRVRDGARARGAAREPSPPTCSTRSLGSVAARRARRDAAARRRRDADPAAAPRGRPARSLAPAIDLERRVRAYLPWPGTFLEADGERLVVGVRVRRGVAAGRRPGTPRARRRPARARDGRRSARAGAASRRRAVARCPARTTCAAARRPAPRLSPRSPAAVLDAAHARRACQRGSPRPGCPCQNRRRWSMTRRPPRRSPVRGSAASRPRTSRPGSPSAATRRTARARCSTPPGRARPPRSPRS